MPDFEFPPGVPEEVQQYWLRQREKTSMAIEDSSRSFDRFFEELTLEQLVTFKDLMDNATARPLAGAFYEGYAAATLKWRFNVCPGCGKDHDAELHEHLAHNIDEQIVKIVHVDMDGGVVVDGEVDPSNGGAITEGMVKEWVDHLAKEPTPEYNGCAVCQGDRELTICTHAPGSHGQAMGEFCPDPDKVPCPYCTPPEWWKNAVGLEPDMEPPLDDSTCHPEGGVYLPTEEVGIYKCSLCGNVRTFGTDD